MWSEVHLWDIGLLRCCSESRIAESKRSLPSKLTITAHPAEILQQVDGAQIPEGGWVCGDALF
jgi:hypothetical protein